MPAQGDELTFDWVSLVPRLVHPFKVMTIEALCWIGAPLSASELEKMVDPRPGVGLVSYHVTTLAETGAIVLVGQRKVRGAIQSFYFLADQAVPAHPAFGDLS